MRIYFESYLRSYNKRELYSFSCRLGHGYFNPSYNRFIFGYSINNKNKFLRILNIKYDS